MKDFVQGTESPGISFAPYLLVTDKSCLAWSTRIRQCELLVMKGCFDMFINFKCPHCGASLQDLSDFAGKKSRCPRCKKAIVVPERESAAQAKIDESARQR